MQVVTGASVRLPNTTLSTTVVTAAELSVNRKARDPVSSATHWSVYLIIIHVSVCVLWLLITMHYCVSSATHWSVYLIITHVCVFCAMAANYYALLCFFCHSLVGLSHYYSCLCLCALVANYYVLLCLFCHSLVGLSHYYSCLCFLCYGC